MLNYKIRSILFLALALLSCRSEDLLETEGGISDDITNENDSIAVDRSSLSNWTSSTHEILSRPNYEVVFNQNEVIRLDLVIGNDEWQTMQADLVANLSSNSGVGRPGMGGGNLVEFDPVWVPCSVLHKGTEWYKVGVRYKGNSSLSSAYQSGVKKLSFKLDFDQYESEFPEIKNQRFYGFKQLSLKNNYDDASLIREKVAADLFRNFGLVSSQTSFCAVYVDFGSGPQYFGLYTLVEEVDDTVLDSQYTNGTGNLYKPDGNAAAFSAGSYNEDEMVKQNNETLADYSDVFALYTAINHSSRTSDVELWKSNLEKSLDVNIFLKWLAANITMQNWDTYGRMTHNYYLYNNPANNLLEWIPWDANEAFQSGKQGGALSFSLTEAGSNWPLIRYIMDVPEYQDKYKAYLAQFINEVFIPAKMQALYTNYYNLLKEYAYAEESGYTFLRNDAAFDSAIETMKSQVTQRNSAVISFLK